MLGNGYATTFFIAFVLTSLGLTALQVLMREPEPPTVRARTALRDRIKDFPALIHGDKGFMWFMIARTFAMGSRIGQPFFFLFAAHTLGVSATTDPVEFGKLLAIFSFAFMAADTAANLVWGYLSDRGGFRSTLVISMALYLASILALMLATSLPLALIAFVGIGAAQSAYVMGSTNIVMEYGHSHDVPMRMALSNTAEGFMGALAPMLGGVLTLIGGYNAAFVAALVSVSVALVLFVWKVDEPRSRKVHEAVRKETEANLDPEP